MEDLAPQKVEYGTYRAYGFGLALSIVLTLAAYFLKISSWFSGRVLNLSITALVLAQALIQLFLFFNLTKEPKPRWNLVVFLFTILVVVILIVGSLWIMYNLNYNLENSR